jgi:hypothetical protein
LRQLFDEIALKSASRADLYQNLVNMLQSQKDRIDGRPGGFRFGGPPRGPPPGGFGFGGPPPGPPGGFGFGGPPPGPPGGVGFGRPLLGPPRDPPPGHVANLRTAASHDAPMAAVWDAEQAQFDHVAHSTGRPYPRRIHQQAQHSSNTYDADIERAIQASLQDAQNAQNGQGGKINTSKFQRKTRSKNNKKIFKKISINRKK